MHFVKTKPLGLVCIGHTYVNQLLAMQAVAHLLSQIDLVSLRRITTLLLQSKCILMIDNFFIFKIL